VISIGNIAENTIQLELDRDTVLLTYAQKEKQKPLKAKVIELENGSSTFLKFRYSDFVKSIDDSKISIMNLKDSSDRKSVLTGKVLKMGVEGGLEKTRNV